jgi:hypothetical protein
MSRLSQEYGQSGRISIGDSIQRKSTRSAIVGVKLALAFAQRYSAVHVFVLVVTVSAKTRKFALGGVPFVMTIYRGVLTCTYRRSVHRRSLRNSHAQGASLRSVLLMTSTCVPTVFPMSLTEVGNTITWTDQSRAPFAIVSMPKNSWRHVTRTYAKQAPTVTMSTQLCFSMNAACGEFRIEATPRVRFFVLSALMLACSHSKFATTRIRSSHFGSCFPFVSLLYVCCRSLLMHVALRARLYIFLYVSVVLVIFA